jgi:hypothetical protein
MAIELGIEVFPGLVNGWLVKKAIYDERVVPVRLVATIFIVASDMVEVAVTAGEESATEATCPEQRGQLAFHIIPLQVPR